MNDLSKYHVHIAGRVNEHEVNATSPVEMKVERVAADSTGCPFAPIDPGSSV